MLELKKLSSPIHILFDLLIISQIYTITSPKRELMGTSGAGFNIQDAFPDTKPTVLKTLKRSESDDPNYGQKALLLQRDSAVRLSVEILQVQNISFENDCNRQMTLKFIHQRSSQWLLLSRSYIISC